MVDWVLLLRLAWDWRDILINNCLLIIINTSNWFSFITLIENIALTWATFSCNFLSYWGDVSRVILILFYYLYIPAKHPYILRPYKYIHPHTHYLSLSWECWNTNKVCQEYLYLLIYLCINRYRCSSASPHTFCQSVQIPRPIEIVAHPAGLLKKCHTVKSKNTYCQHIKTWGLRGVRPAYRVYIPHKQFCQNFRPISF